MYFKNVHIILQLSNVNTLLVFNNLVGEECPVYIMYSQYYPSARILTFQQF